MSPSAPRTRWWPAHPWVGALALLTTAFLAVALPPYLTLDPGRSRSRVPADFPMYYPLLVTHLFLGTIVLVTACLQVWPWLRGRHPAVHRWAGRGYVAAVLVASPCVLVIAPLGSFGPNEHVALTLLGLLWPATTIVGCRMARRRRFAEHREWMIRSVALSFSIVTNRAWAALCVPLFVPASLAEGSVEWQAALAQAMGVAFWLCWVVNLLVAEWWIQRRRRVRGAARQKIAPKEIAPKGSHRRRSHRETPRRRWSRSGASRPRRAGSWRWPRRQGRTPRWPARRP